MRSSLFGPRLAGLVVFLALVALAAALPEKGLVRKRSASVAPISKMPNVASTLDPTSAVVTTGLLTAPAASPQAPATTTTTLAVAKSSKTKAKVAGSGTTGGGTVTVVADSTPTIDASAALQSSDAVSVNLPTAAVADQSSPASKGTVAGGVVVLIACGHLALSLL